MQFINAALELFGCLLLGELMVYLEKKNEDWSVGLVIAAVMGICGLAKLFTHSKLVVEKVGRNLEHDLTIMWHEPKFCGCTIHIYKHQRKQYEC